MSSVDVQSFVGRQEIQQDIADPQRVARLAATLDHNVPPWDAGVLPLLGHWLCFQPQVRQSLIAHDGHPLRTDGGLLPTVDLSQRMWAGSRIQFLRDIPLGAPIVRTSTVTSVTPKSGRSGAMIFVTLLHRIAHTGAEPAIVEEQDIVYREAAEPGTQMVRPITEVGPEDPITRQIEPDPVMLFRYSALTFNSHRIHYDRDYSRDEGYPSLVIQGPLLATLLLDHLLRQQPPARVMSYSFRASSPIFEGEAITLGLTQADNIAKLRAIGPAGVAMTAIAEFSL
jgi:3-methylfumaryl-CoA hydratase